MSNIDERTGTALVADTADGRGNAGARPAPLAAPHWRVWMAKHPTAAASVAGLIATQMATLSGYYFIGVGLPQLPWPLYNGVLDAPGSTYGTAGSFFIGHSMHLTNGVVFAILFALLIHRRLPLPDTPAGDIWKGLFWRIGR